MILSILATLGIGSGLIWLLFGVTAFRTILDIVSPFLKQVVKWFTQLLDWVFKRLLKEIRSLSDVFPILTFALVFSLGGLVLGWSSSLGNYFSGPNCHCHEKVSTRRQPGSNSGFLQGIDNWIQRQFR